MRREPDAEAPARRWVASARPRSTGPVQEPPTASGEQPPTASGEQPPTASGEQPPTASDEQLDELIMGLEHDQLVAARSGRLPPARLGGRSRLALWALRIFVLIVGAMVIYTFFAQL